MKKLIITGAACTAMALSGFAQGTVAFQNTAFTQFYFNSTASTANKVTSATIGSQPASGISTSTGVMDVGLYYSTAAFTDPSMGTLVDMVTMSTTTPGTILGATVATPGGYGAQAYVQVFAWDSTYANPDEAMAAGAFFGASSAGQVNTNYGAIGAAQLITLGVVSPAPGAPIFGTSGTLFPRTICLINSPEPATIALGGLGAAALMLFRRRK